MTGKKMVEEILNYLKTFQTPTYSTSLLLRLRGKSGCLRTSSNIYLLALLTLITNGKKT